MCCGQRDLRDLRDVGDVWGKPDRLNHAAIIGTQVLGEREAMARRMGAAVLNSLGIRTLGPAMLGPGDQGDG